MRRKEGGREVVLFVVRTGARMGHEEGVGVCGEASLAAALDAKPRRGEADHYLLPTRPGHSRRTRYQRTIERIRV
jgi:hypothetical protein